MHGPGGLAGRRCGTRPLRRWPGFGPPRPTRPPAPGSDVDDPALPNRRERVREVVERRMREVEDDAVDRRDFLEDTAGSPFLRWVSGRPRGAPVFAVGADPPRRLRRRTERLRPTPVSRGVGRTG